MTYKEINRKTPEGRLLHMAIIMLQTMGPPETKDKEPDEIISMLDESATAFENVKM